MNFEKYLKIRAISKVKIGSTHSDKTLQKEKGGSTERTGNGIHLCLGQPEDCTAFPIVSLHLSCNPEGLQDKLVSTI